MAKKIYKNKKIVITLLVVAAALAVAALVVKHNRDQARKEVEKTAQENHAKNDVSKSSDNTSSTGSTTSNGGSSASQTSSAESTPPTPTLSKSSGNNGSIPAGVPVSFGCQSTAGLNCTILLTGPSNLNLGTKTIPSDGTDRPGTTWYWTSVSGSWKVVAQITNSSGKSSNSAAQTLVVQ